MTLIWKNKELKTMGDIMDVVKQIYEMSPGSARREQALLFMREYRDSVNPSSKADDNVRFGIDYFGMKNQTDVLSLFGLNYIHRKG